MVRYKLTKDCRYYYLPSDRVEINAQRSDYFVDILGDGRYDFIFSVRLLTPDGEIIACEVLKDYVTLDNEEELFDGRFNQIK